MNQYLTRGLKMSTQPDYDDEFQTLQAQTVQTLYKLDKYCQTSDINYTDDGRVNAHLITKKNTIQNSPVSSAKFSMPQSSEDSPILNSQQYQHGQNDKSKKKLQFQISKLKMQVSLLRIQNEALSRKCAFNRDQYYQQVINNMQLKIQELISTSTIASQENKQ